MNTEAFHISTDRLNELSDVVTFASDSLALLSEKLGFNVVHAEGGCFIDSECGGNIVSVYLPRELGHQIPKNSIVSVLPVDEDGNPLGSYRKCVTFAQFESVYHSVCEADMNQDIVSIVRKYFNLTNSAWRTYLSNQGVVSEGNIMNKVIARLKQLASPLKKWGDVLEVFLSYSFKEYNGVAVMQIKDKYTLSVAPSSHANGSARVPASSSADTLRVGLHVGKAATDTTLVDSVIVKVGKFTPETLSGGLRGWLSQYEGISPQFATALAKKIGRCYQDILDGGSTHRPKDKRSLRGAGHNR